jgi:hypothetical protein
MRESVSRGVRGEAEDAELFFSASSRSPREPVPFELRRQPSQRRFDRIDHFRPLHFQRERQHAIR